jgi:hypothetical protein
MDISAVPQPAHVKLRKGSSVSYETSDANPKREEQGRPVSRFRD